MAKSQSAQFVKASAALVALVLVITVLNFSITAFMVIRERYFPEKYRSLVYKIAEEQSLPPLLIAAVIFSESHFGKEKVSKSGAIGMMQIKPSILQELERLKIIPKESYTEEDLYKPNVNIEMGTAYIKYLLKRVVITKEREEKIREWYYEDPYFLMLFSYHSGPTYILQLFDNAENFDDFVQKIQNRRPTTWKYANRVMDVLSRLEWIDEIFSYN